MSIDADLKSGIITNEEVQIRRKELGQESQLYGSFDGAMKFIKGDDSRHCHYLRELNWWHIGRYGSNGVIYYRGHYIHIHF